MFSGPNVIWKLCMSICNLRFSLCKKGVLKDTEFFSSTSWLWKPCLWLRKWQASLCWWKSWQKQEYFKRWAGEWFIMGKVICSLAVCQLLCMSCQCPGSSQFPTWKAGQATCRVLQGCEWELGPSLHHVSFLVPFYILRHCSTWLRAFSLTLFILHACRRNDALKKWWECCSDAFNHAETLLIMQPLNATMSVVGEVITVWCNCVVQKLKL